MLYLGNASVIKLLVIKIGIIASLRTLSKVNVNVSGLTQTGR